MLATVHTLTEITLNLPKTGTDHIPVVSGFCSPLRILSQEFHVCLFFHSDFRFLPIFTSALETDESLHTKLHTVVLGEIS